MSQFLIKFKFLIPYLAQLGFRNVSYIGVDVL